jgi:exopolysaccharide production protein ExoQ
VSNITQALAFIFISGLLVNETYGPVVLGLGIMGWAAYSVGFMDRAKEALLDGGVLIWLMPVLAMMSYFWSDEPAITFRAALETMVMVACMIFIAKTVPPRSFLFLLFLTLALIALASVPINNLTYDFLAGKSNRTGIFLNKNTFSTCSAILVLASGAILLDRRQPTWLRFATVPLIGLGIVQNLMANSVAASLALALSMLWGGSMFTAGLVPAKMRKTYVTSLVIGGIVLLGVGVLLATAFNDELLAMVGKDASLTGRTDLWFYGARIIAAGSGFGVGYNAFWIPGHAMAEYLWAMEHIPPGGGFSFHHLYYEIAVELGWPGVLIGAIVIGVTFFLAVRWLREDTNPESIFFFTLMVFILIIETQGYDLFATFNALHGEYLAIFLYGRNWPAWRQGMSQVRAGASRPRQVTLVRAPDGLGPT